MSEENHSYRMSITDPRFRYPQSRNPYWIKLTGTHPSPLSEMQNEARTDHDAESLRGRWQEVFKSKMGFEPDQLVVEIGCNAGHVLVEKARLSPKTAFIGIDWKPKAIVRAVEKARRKELQNTFFVRGHARRLAFLFAPNEIDELLVYFPDPWPKHRQTGNRLLSDTFLEAAAPLFKAHGRLHLKTDHREYFDWILVQISKSPSWKLESHTFNLHAGHPDPVRLEIPEVTLFEKLFIRDGLPIHEAKLVRAL